MEIGDMSIIISNISDTNAQIDIIGQYHDKERYYQWICGDQKENSILPTNQTDYLTFNITSLSPDTIYTFIYWYGDNENYQYYNSLSFSTLKSKELKPFHWTGTFEGEEIDTDSTKVIKGQPITNITAEVWNNQLIPRIRLLEELQGKESSYIPFVNTGDMIGYSDFNTIRNSIAKLDGGSGIIPVLQQNDPIRADLFANKSNSIKEILNYIISFY